MTEQAARPRQIRREAFTVQECMFRIQTALFNRKKVYFTELFEASPTREEIVSVFVALLEMIKLERVAVMQEATYGELVLYAKDRRKANGA